MEVDAERPGDQEQYHHGPEREERRSAFRHAVPEENDQAHDVKRERRPLPGIIVVLEKRELRRQASDPEQEDKEQKAAEPFEVVHWHRESVVGGGRGRVRPLT